MRRRPAPLTKGGKGGGPLRLSPQRVPCKRNEASPVAPRSHLRNSSTTSQLPNPYPQNLSRVVCFLIGCSRFTGDRIN